MEGYFILKDLIRDTEVKMCLPWIILRVAVQLYGAIVELRAKLKNYLNERRYIKYY